MLINKHNTLQEYRFCDILFLNRISVIGGQYVVA